MNDPTDEHPDLPAKTVGLPTAAATLDLSPRGLKVLIQRGLLPKPTEGRWFALSSFDEAWILRAGQALASRRDDVRSTLLALGIKLPKALRQRPIVPIEPAIPPVKDSPSGPEFGKD